MTEQYTKEQKYELFKSQTEEYLTHKEAVSLKGALALFLQNKVNATLVNHLSSLTFRNILKFSKI